jgi:hypothetical protein
MAKVPDRPTDCPPFMVFDEKAKRWVNKAAKDLTWDETEEILRRLDLQFKMIHDLPKIEKDKPDVYMNEALWGLRRMCQDLHWRRIAIVSKK